MATLQDILKLAKADSGKFFVMDESGEVKLVIMPVEDYEKILVGRLQKTAVDIEQVNKEITKAQLTNQVEPDPSPILETRAPRVDMRSEVIDPSFNFDGPETDDLEV
jgi:hypothetical protein